VLHADKTANITVLRVVLVQQGCLISAKHGFINAKRSHLQVIEIANINREVAPVPGWLHPAVSKEKQVDLVRIGVL
jgi:hypothetical protein